jgi:hypothetical protein
MLRQRDLQLYSRGLLHQLLNYDGRRKKRVKGIDGETHHFDRARTAVMAADILSRRRFTVATIENESEYVPGQLTISDLDRYDNRLKSKENNPFQPPPREWM